MFVKQVENNDIRHQIMRYGTGFVWSCYVNKWKTIEILNEIVIFGSDLKLTARWFLKYDLRIVFCETEMRLLKQVFRKIIEIVFLLIIEISYWN